MLGQIVGQYRILERLGSGGMGEVYLAEDLKLKRKAAIKFISAELTRDRTRRERFVQEATLAASVDHPHIAAIYDVDDAGDRTFIAMEYVRGETLRESIRHGALPLRRVLDLSIQIADALAKVHQHGVMHRDLKPENVIVSPDGYAKIIDFGLAKLTEPLAALAGAETATNLQVRTADGLVMGTVAYMSPEQARGDQIDSRSDIFSFGVLLHELLTGTSPFRRKSAAETLSAILTVAPAEVTVADPAAAPELQRIVRKCLVKDAEGRYQSMREVVVDLRGVRDQLASGTQSVTMATTAARPSRGRAAALAALGLVTIAALGGWLWWRTRGPGPGGTNASGRPAIAVLAFDNLSKAEDIAWLSAGLPSMLVTGLAQSPEVEVITSDRLNEAARQSGKQTFTEIDAASRLDIVRRAGATIVVNGTVIRAGDGLRIDARVEDLASSRVVLADYVRGPDPLALADELAARIRQQLNLRTAGAVRPVSEITSTSVEAYRLFALGVEAATNARPKDARKFLSEAIAIDPDFALAQLWMYRIPTLPFDERTAHLAQAEKHLNRLTERDALSVEAAVAESQNRGQDALTKYERLIARYPDATDAYQGASNIYRFFIGDPTKALEIMERCLAANPTAGHMYNSLGYVYLENGKTKEAAAAFEKYVKLRPHEPNTLDSLAEAHLANGNTAVALDTANRARAAGHEGSPVTIAWIRAVTGDYAGAFEGLNPRSFGGLYARARLGQYQQVDKELDKGLEMMGMPADGLAAVAEVLRAVIALDQGDCRTVLARLTAAGKAAKLPPGGPTALVDLLAGTCEARLGLAAEARARLDKHKNELMSPAIDVRWWVRQLEGEIALTAGDASAALAAFQAGEPARKLPFNRSGPAAVLTLLSNSLILRDGPARVRIAQGRLDDAITIYRRLLVTDQASKYTSVYEPRYVLAIARLLDKTGKKAEARAEYKRFLDFWKDADAGLPELVEARAKAR